MKMRRMPLICALSAHGKRCAYDDLWLLVGRKAVKLNGR